MHVLLSNIAFSLDLADDELLANVYLGFMSREQIWNHAKSLRTHDERHRLGESDCSFSLFLETTDDFITGAQLERNRIELLVWSLDKHVFP